MDKSKRSKVILLVAWWAWLEIYHHFVRCFLSSIVEKRVFGFFIKPSLVLNEVCDVDMDLFVLEQWHLLFSAFVFFFC